MPIDRSKYPKNWDEISRAIRARSGGRCECLGDCGHNHGAENVTILKEMVLGRVDGEIELNDKLFDRDADIAHLIADVPFRCVATNGGPHPITGSHVVLTVAHLDHDPSNNNSGNLRAFCQRCHNAYDAPFRRKNRARNRDKRAIDAGQMTIFDDDFGVK